MNRLFYFGKICFCQMNFSRQTFPSEILFPEKFTPTSINGKFQKWNQVTVDTINQHAFFFLLFKSIDSRKGNFKNKFTKCLQVENKEKHFPFFFLAWKISNGKNERT